MSPKKPEEKAREEIGTVLTAVGWIVQHVVDLNLVAARGIAAREYLMARGYGRAASLLFLGSQAVGALEPKPAGYSLTGVERQALKYAGGMPGVTAEE